MSQPNLFQKPPKYCIDTNVIISFMKQEDNESYGTDIFKPQWEFLEKAISVGLVIAPIQVKVELLEWSGVIPEMKAWVKAHANMFAKVESVEQLQSAKRILAKYPVYGRTKNYLGDLAVMTLADARKLTVISLESEAEATSSKRPKIPNICKEYKVDCTSFAGFLRKEGFGSEA